MTGNQLAHYRKKTRLTQAGAARVLGVSQTYLSLLESGKRPVTEQMKKKAVRAFDLSPTEMPVDLSFGQLPDVSDDQLASDLARLGYEGFSHLKPSARLKNPAVVLLSGLNAAKRDVRLVEALPWVVFGFPDMNWVYLARTAKAHDLQNRLGFVTNVARRVAENRGDKRTAAKLEHREAELSSSRLAREETLCNESMTNAERKWLSEQRPAAAKHWNLLTDLSPQNLSYYEH